MSSVALAQRRQVDREHVEAVEQVLAQLAARDRLVRVAVGRGDDAHVGLLDLGRADAHEGARLEHAQQLDLEVERHLGDLVEEQRAAVGALEEAQMLALGAGEAALLVAEDLAFHQVRRDRAAVDGEERMAAAPAEVVDRSRDDFLAGAALAGDEHRDRRRRDADDLLVDAPHRRRAAPERAEVALALERRFEVAGGGLQRRRLGHPRQHALELLQAHRLDEVVGGAEAKRLDRGVEAGVAGDQHQLGVGQLLDVAEQLHAAAVGQHQVEQDDVGLLQRHLAPRIAQRSGGGDGEALVGDQHRHRFRGVGVVVDEQGVRHSNSSFLETGQYGTSLRHGPPPPAQPAWYAGSTARLQPARPIQPSDSAYGNADGPTRDRAGSRREQDRRPISTAAASGCQPSTAIRTKKPSDVADGDVPSAHDPRLHRAGLGKLARQRDAGRRAEPDHRAAEADRVGEKAPVVAALAQGERGERDVVEDGGDEAEAEGDLPRRRRQRLDRHHRRAQDEADEEDSAARRRRQDAPVGPDRRREHEQRRPHRQADRRQAARATRPARTGRGRWRRWPRRGRRRRRRGAPCRW